MQAKPEVEREEEMMTPEAALAFRESHRDSLGLPVGRQSYADVKAFFELRRAKVYEPHVCFTVQYDHDLDILGIDQFRVLHKDWVFWERDKKDPGGRLVKYRFTLRWMMDQSKRTFHHIGFDPRNQLDPSVMNLWRGFDGARYAGMNEDGKRVEAVEFLSRLVKGRQEHLDWLLDWFGQIVQTPWAPTRVGVVFYTGGRPHAGIEAFLDWFRRQVLGMYCTCAVHYADHRRKQQGMYAGAKVFAVVKNAAWMWLDFTKYVTGTCREVKFHKQCKHMALRNFECLVNVAFVADSFRACEVCHVFSCV